MPDEAVSCTVCGAPLAASQIPQQPDYQQQAYQQQAYQQQAYQQQPYQQQPYQQQAYQQPYGAAVPGNGKATASLVLGILSLILPGLPLGIIGIVLGVQARNAMPEGTPDRGKATAGLVCSIIGCAWGGIAIICYACSAIAAGGTSTYYALLSGLL
jgi:Interferon-induced transmembrane protein.